jgi:hypothetical protein
MVAFLPELPGAAGLVCGFASRQEVEQPAPPLEFELSEEFPCGEFLQIGDHSGRSAACNSMEVVLHDDPRVELEPFLSLAEAKRTRKNVAAG